MRLLGSFGPFRFIEGLPLPPEAPPLEQPPAQARGCCRCPALQRPVPPASAVAAAPAGDPLVQRMDRLETHVVGVTSRLDRQTELLEQIVRHQGLIPDDELGPSTQ
ncbi:unnamed protein product [Linum trigynum]|uniref:Uncharacterized protein n=1 Tax=Linum trigynum TaxID=586398 RepID=A0AAV2ETP2_9ROSI